jgi:UDP-N-acetylmuramate dehydrogenase
MAVTLTENASLRSLNSFGVEAQAARLMTVTQTHEMPEALSLARDCSPVLILGAGSNVLFTRNYPGTVLHVNTRGIRIIDPETEGDADLVLVQAEAGEPWDSFVRWTIDQGLGGLENLALIPGTVGASPVQNIGAYGVEMCECFESLDAIEVETGKLRRLSAEQCHFGYRDSIFKSAQVGRWLITRVRFRLSRNPTLRFDYADLRAALQQAGIANPGPREIADAVSSIRRSKLPDPARLGNAGSFFKNPVITMDRARRLLEQEPALVHWPDRADVKLSAAWMIDQAGFKGYRQGDAAVHESHALVLVNHGAASGAQILALAGTIQEAVLQRFGVRLEPEPLVL